MDKYFRNFAMNIWRFALRQRKTVLLAVLFLSCIYLALRKNNGKSESAYKEIMLKRLQAQDEPPNLAVHAVNYYDQARCQIYVDSNIPEDISGLASQVEGIEVWTWILRRIKATWPQWKEAARQLQKQPYLTQPRRKKQILIVPGVLIATPFAKNNTIKDGGPLGDLYQWSDVIAALHVLGHNVTLTKDIYFAARGLRYDSFLWSTKPGCSQQGFDLVYTDIITMKALSRDNIRRNSDRNIVFLVQKWQTEEEVPQLAKPKQPCRLVWATFQKWGMPVHDTYTQVIMNLIVTRSCLFRVLDAYGTEQMFNNFKYSLIHDYESQYGQLDMNLKQFYTFYPHTPDNSFMGFTLSNVHHKKYEKENIGLLYGKDPAYFQGKGDFIKLLLQSMNVHSTLNSSHTLPAGVKNHGVVSREAYQTILAKAKYFIGVGLPMESTGVMEALAHGCIFINPKYIGQQQYALLQQGKPTTRLMTSQIPYLESRVGPPNVLTVDISNDGEVTRALSSLENMQVRPYLPYEFSMLGFLERLNTYIENQDFCNATKIWPPLHLLKLFAGQTDQSCNDVCSQRHLLCENAFFTALNESKIFESFTKCDSVKIEASVYHPSFSTAHGKTKCFLQESEELLSCAGSHELLNRICPCRNYRKEQVALWDDSG